MLHQQNAFQLPETGLSGFSTPLLDEGFDPGEEEIFDHSDLTPLQLVNHTEDEFEV